MHLLVTISKWISLSISVLLVGFIILDQIQGGDKQGIVTYLLKIPAMISVIMTVLFFILGR